MRATAPGAAGVQTFNESAVRNNYGVLEYRCDSAILLIFRSQYTTLVEPARRWYRAPQRARSVLQDYTASFSTLYVH